jgi:hypothetical protein
VLTCGKIQVHPSPLGGLVLDGSPIAVDAWVIWAELVEYRLAISAKDRDEKSRRQRGLPL